MSTASVAEPLKRTLAAKPEFIRTSLKAGKVPTGPMLASFLQALVHEMGPHVKASPPALQEFLKSGLASLGWNVATNSAAPGSAPPQARALLGFLDGALAECAAMSGSPRYGTALAESVAAELMTGRDMVYSHRDYCGIGLTWESATNRFRMGECMDGGVMGDLGTWTEEEFVAWLAQQSDESLRGDGNQRISRGRILQWLPLGVVELLAASDLPIAKTHRSIKAAEAAQAAARAAQATARAAKEQAATEEKVAEKARVQAAKDEKVQQELAAALATDEASLANMSKKEVIELIRKATSPESDLLTANARVLMSPASTKEQVVALWRQVRETVMASPTL